MALFKQIMGVGKIIARRRRAFTLGVFPRKLRVFSCTRKSIFRCFETFWRPSAEAGNREFPVSGMLFSTAPFLIFGFFGVGCGSWVDLGSRAGKSFRIWEFSARKNPLYIISKGNIIKQLN